MGFERRILQTEARAARRSHKSFVYLRGTFVRLRVAVSRLHSRARRARNHEVERPRDIGLHVFAMDDGIEHTVLSRNSLRWNPSGSLVRMVCSITRGPAKPMSA